MATIILGWFDDLDDVDDTVAALTETGFTRNDINNVTTRSWITSEKKTTHETAELAVELMSEPEEAAKQVAQQLGNTPSVCRQYYIHPAVLDAYRSGSLEEAWQQAEQNKAISEGRIQDKDSHGNDPYPPKDTNP